MDGCTQVNTQTLLQSAVCPTVSYSVTVCFIHNQHLCTCVQTLNVVMPAAAASGGTTAQTVPAKVLDCDTITQVKEKLLEQTWKGTSFSQRPHIDSLHLGESDSFHNSITLSCVSVFSYVRILIIEMQTVFFFFCVKCIGENKTTVIESVFKH